MFCRQLRLMFTLLRLRRSLCTLFKGGSLSGKRLSSSFSGKMPGNFSGEASGSVSEKVSGSFNRKKMSDDFSGREVSGSFRGKKVPGSFRYSHRCLVQAVCCMRVQPYDVLFSATFFGFAFALGIIFR